jgi:hypothetical protein
MARGVPRPLWRDVDVSANDPRWRCPVKCVAYRHRPGSPCPPVRVWLVASICLRCRPSPAGTYYCTHHNLDSYFK